MLTPSTPHAPNRPLATGSSRAVPTRGPCATESAMQAATRPTPYQAPRAPLSLSQPFVCRHVLPMPPPPPARSRRALLPPPSLSSPSFFNAPSSSISLLAVLLQCAAAPPVCLPCVLPTHACTSSPALASLPGPATPSELSAAHLLHGPCQVLLHVKIDAGRQIGAGPHSSSSME